MIKKLFLVFFISVPLITIAQVNNDFIKLQSSLRYKIIEDKKQPKVQINSYVSLLLTYSTESDSIIFSSNMIGAPTEVQITSPQYHGDPMEGYLLLGVGDSAVFLIPADSMFKSYPDARPPFIKVGSLLKLGVRMVQATSIEEYNKLKLAEAQKQIAIDDLIIQNYIKANNLSAKKTASGLYYVIEKQGDGVKVENGKKVTVNYTGKLTDGRIFDSSTFAGRTPFQFTIGAHNVIAGWDEGIPLFNVGGKGILLIPSALGYGSQGMSGVIPSNAVLIFDIEVLSVSDK